MAQGDSFIKYSDFIVPDESIEKLIALLENVNSHMDAIARKVPVTADQMAKSIKKVTGVTVDGEDALAEFSVFIDKLEKAYRELAYAQSDFGKTAAIVKEQTKETNKETVSQYKNSKLLKDSIDALNVALREYTNLFKSLSAGERVSAFGADTIREIRDLALKIGDSQKELKASVAAVNDYIRAQVNLGKQNDTLANKTAAYNAEAAKIAKQHKLNAAVATTEQTSLAGLKARIDLLTNTYRNYDETLRESMQGQTLLDQITSLTIQYEELNAKLNTNTLSSEALGNATRKAALAHSDQAAQIAKLNVETQQAIDLNRALAQLEASKSGEAQLIAETNEKIAEQNELNKLNAKLKLNNIAVDAEGRKGINLLHLSYDQLSLIYQANAIELRKLTFTDKDAREELENMQRQITSIMTTMDTGISAGRGQIGRLSKDFNGLSFSISQLLREAPAAAVSMNTFFLAISNNIPMVAEQVQRVIAANKLARKEGLETVSAIKQIGKSLLSFNVLIIALTTALTFFGDDLLKLAAKIFQSNSAAATYRRTLRHLRKELKDSSGEYGEALTTLHKLQLEWANLRTEADKTKWIKNSTSEFNKLGIAINNINDAENAFVKNSKAIIESLELRARAAAAEKLASEQYEQSLRAGVRKAVLKDELKAYEAQIRNEYVQRALANFRGGAGTAYVRGKGVQTREQATASAIAEANKELATSKTRAGYEKKIEKAKENSAKYSKEAARYIQLGYIYSQKVLDTLNKAGIEPEYLKDSSSGADAGTGRERNIEEYVRNMYTTVLKRANLAEAKSFEQGYEQQYKEIEAKYDNELAELTKTHERNLDILNKRNGYETIKLTEEQRTKILAAEALMDEALVNLELEKNEKLELLQKKHYVDLERLNLDNVNNRLETVKKGSQEELNLLLDRLEAERKIALAENNLRPAAERRDPSLINARFDKQAKLAQGSFILNQAEQRQEARKAEFYAYPEKLTEVQTARFDLQQEKAMWDLRIKLAEAGMLDWSDIQIKAAKQTRDNVLAELKRLPAGFNEIMATLAEYGPGGALLHALGFDNDQIEAMKSATDTILGFISDILQAEVDAANKEVELAEQRVQAAEEALDYELEARANGYANSVATAQAEYDKEKEFQRQKEKLLAEAQRRQEAIDTATQASSLLTTTALLWKEMVKGGGLLGPILAGTAIAAMWASFIGAKVKARQVAQTYGEGGLEILQGGSHASGHDIDLGVNNRKNKRMRAEGGEALAIINKKRTKQYRSILPSIIDSLNKGTFEQTYTRAFDTPAQLQIAGVNSTIDLSKLEKDVVAIKQELSNRIYIDGENTIVKSGHYTRIIKR